MSLSPDWTVLVQDLLSPAGTSLPSATPALISYHLATTTHSDSDKLATLIHAICTSPSLWHAHPAAPLAQSTTSPGAGGSELPLELVRSVFNTTRNGTLYRVDEIKREHGSGWSGQRQLGRWLRVVVDSVAGSGARAEVRAVVVGAVLNGLQDVKARRDKMHVGGESMIGLVEKEFVACCDQLLSHATASDCKPSCDSHTTAPHRSEILIAHLFEQPSYRG